MRRLSSLLLVSFLLLTALASADSQRIVGGTDVPPGKYPWVAKISIEPGFQCTGTLIAPTWVLTAGHCSSLTGIAIPSPIPSNPLLYTVTLGGVKTDGSDSETYSVASVSVPPSYSAQNGSGSDVGLLELTEPVPLTPLKLAALDERSIWATGKTVTAAGFGVTASGGDQPANMQEVDVFVVGDGECAAAYDDLDPATEVCAGVPEGGKDSCQGDSGGPLMARTGDELRLVGATSRGQGCAEPGFPGIYARVAEGLMREFVLETVGAGAFAPEGVSEGMTAGPTGPAGPAATPTPTTAGPGMPAIANPLATPTPNSNSNSTARTCAGRSGLSFRVRSRGRAALRKVRVRLNGKTLVSRRAKKVKPFRVQLAERLSSDGTNKVRVFTRTSRGVRRVTVRTYTDCELTGTRTRQLRMV
ncbi:MAG: serine protease [Solirubrobacteraceae bacterium]